MVATRATRHSNLCFGIEAEECPIWAQSLIGIQPPQEVLGVSFERVSPMTREAQITFFPPPPARLQKKTRHVPVLGKTYVKSWPIAFYEVCLSFALGKQPDLFVKTHWQDGPEDIAVLCFSTLYSFAKKLGMSYDQVEQWMMLLIVLGFIRRFRHGRRFLYVIPLADYCPHPGPEVIRDRLNAFISKQFRQVIGSDGTVTERSRSPEFTEYLIQVRTRFEKCYGLVPTEPKSISSPVGTLLDEMLEEIHQVLPTLSQEELARLRPIMLKHFSEQTQFSKTKASRQSAKSGKTATESTVVLSDESTTVDSVAVAQVSDEVPFSVAHETSDDDRTESRKGKTESVVMKQNLQENTEPTQCRFTSSSQGTSRVASTFTPAISDPQQEYPMQGSKPDSITASLLTSRLSLPLLKNEDYVNVSAEVLDQYRIAEKEKQCLELGKELAGILLDKENEENLATMHRRGNPSLIRAALIMTMHTGLNAKFTTSAGACFKYYYDTWSKYNSYSTACEAWQKWGSKESKGIPKKVQILCNTFQNYTYQEIAQAMGFEMDRATKQPYPLSNQRGGSSSSRMVAPVRGLSKHEAENLALDIHRHAHWYLANIQVAPAPQKTAWDIASQMSSGTERYCVAAEGDCLYTFASREEWQSLHESMLMLPPVCEQWYGAVSEGQTIGAKDEELCVYAAMAFLEYCNKGLDLRSEARMDWSRFSWNRLVSLGRPIRFPHEENVSEWRKLENGLALSNEQYQELLAAGEIVELDEAGTCLTFNHYQACYLSSQQTLLEEQESLTVEGLLRLMMNDEGESFTRQNPLHTSACGLEISTVEAGGNEGSISVDTSERTLLSAEDALNLQEVQDGYRCLTNALDPLLYHVEVKTSTAVRNGFELRVISLLSSTTWIYTTCCQIEELLQSLLVSEVKGEEDEIQLSRLT